METLLHVNSARGEGARNNTEKHYGRGNMGKRNANRYEKRENRVNGSEGKRRWENTKASCPVNAR